MSETIKFKVVVGVTHNGGWCVADSGDAVPLGVEHMIDQVWEGICCDDSLGDGYEIYVLDVELPRPVRHPPVQATPSGSTPTIRVDSKDAVLRGRTEALERVLERCELDEDACARVRAMLTNVDSDW